MPYRKELDHWAQHSVLILMSLKLFVTNPWKQQIISISISTFSWMKWKDCLGSCCSLLFSYFNIPIFHLWGYIHSSSMCIAIVFHHLDFAQNVYSVTNCWADSNLCWFLKTQVKLPSIFMHRILCCHVFLPFWGWLPRSKIAKSHSRNDFLLNFKRYWEIISQRSWSLKPTSS